MPITVTEELPPIPANISSLTGPPLLGFMLNWCLFGALTVQVYIYSQSFPNERKWIKCLVYGLYLVEIVQTVLATTDAFQWFAFGFGNMVTLSRPWISSIDAPIMDGLIALIVQLFFCWRIWVLGKHWFLPATIGAVALIQCTGALITGVRSIEINDVTKMQSSTVYLVIWYAGSALADTLIAIAMTFLLMRSGSDGFHGGDILRRVVRLTIETNSMTAVVAIVGFVTFVAFPNTSMFMAPSLTIGKLYSNTMMVSFNNRIFLALMASKGRGVTASGRSEELSRAAQLVNISRGIHSHSEPDQVVTETPRESKPTSDFGFGAYELKMIHGENSLTV